MLTVPLEYGDGHVRVEVPDSALVFWPGRSHQDPPQVDPAEATQRALEAPLGLPPLRELVRPGSRVVIAFPDRVKGGAHDRAHRKVAIPIIIEELERAGVRPADIVLLCAMGLHRKNTYEELAHYLGRPLVEAFWPDRLLMHDAEDPAGITALGTTEHGDLVEVNRLVAEADLAILIGHTQGNPYGGYSGGYKMAATGITTWRSIRGHHSPRTMLRSDFVPVNVEHSQMRRQFDAIGRAIERGMGKRFFCVDAVLGTDSQVLGVFAGAPDAVQAASWPLASRRTDVPLDIAEPFDVVVFGLPRSFHYGPGMGTNPILMLQAIGAQIVRHRDVLREGVVVIAASLCDGWFNDSWFPSYRVVFERLVQVNELAEVSAFEEEICTDPRLVWKYRAEYAYHPFHAFSMVYMGAVAHRYAERIFIVGARAPGYARAVGCVPVATFADALRRAERIVGAVPRILVLPQAFTRVPVHLRRGRR
ncbi:MAG: lactate racemase domain-containing protein [Armatimonadota bacterium]|nr:lactate racemase domain-containing protein [Armatimonadota bacterium]MDR7475418.1 lactate racemase domain-containing protein [Armatimonadota bacterium]MDR7540179.1 lactate racemase domain-containing protein [Armatimonadota bacterium]